MGGSRILSDEQIDLVCEMRERGLSYQQIVNRFATMGVAVSVGSVGWACLSHGADLPPHRRRPHKGPVAGETYQRNGHSIRTFTPEDDAKLLALEAAGFGYSAIGRELGRKPNSIRGRFLTLARHQARAEEVANG